MTAAGSLRCCESPILPDSSVLSPAARTSPRQLPPPQGTHSSSQICCKGLNCAVKVSRVRKAGGGKCLCWGADQLI